MDSIPSFSPKNMQLKIGQLLLESKSPTVSLFSSCTSTYGFVLLAFRRQADAPLSYYYSEGIKIMHIQRNAICSGIVLRMFVDPIARVLIF